MGAPKGKPSWNAGSGKGWVDRRGYRWIRVDGRSVREHRHIIERHLGRKLLPTEIVHHRNGDTADNRLDNLEVMNGGDHMRHHHKGETRPDMAKQRMSRAARDRETIRRLTSANADLLEALKQCIQLAWEDSREISFDSTVKFGIGYDFDGVDKFRMEVHTPIGSWMVWPSGYRYSVYRDNGDMWFEQFDSRADAEELVLSCIDRLCPTYPTAVARAAIAKATGEA